MSSASPISSPQVSRDARNHATAVVTILSCDASRQDEQKLAKIIQFLGGTVKHLRVESISGHGQPAACLVASVEALKQLTGGGDLRSRLASLATNTLVYGFEPIPAHNELLQAFSTSGCGEIRRQPAGPNQIAISTDHREFCRQLAGLIFEIPNRAAQAVFGKGDFSPIICLNGEPLMVRVPNQNAQIILLAGSEIADLDAPAPSDASVLNNFCGLAPWLMFLRASLGDTLWHNSSSPACLIIDDPLLKRRYGFLEYEKLLEQAQKSRFSASIAFIPWNYKRSERPVAELFRRHSERISLCVHGCDHTRGEFGDADFELLRGKAQRALDRMRTHHKLSDVGFDEVMVFPQGIFSTTAMKAIKATRYLAAVNSTAFPVDAEALTLRDLLEVAVTRFSNFPLFTRRYPRQLSELAFDLFLGKPAFLVEHHGFFEDGYEPLAAVIAKLYTLEPRLRWTNLAAACQATCRQKIAANGDIHVNFFTNKFRLHNRSGQSQNYVLSRKRQPDQSVKSVACNGQSVDFSLELDEVTARLRLSPGESAELGVDFGPEETREPSTRRRAVYEAKVFVRRSLSEFRDNYVQPGRRLSGRVKAFKSLAKTR